MSHRSIFYGGTADIATGDSRYWDEEWQAFPSTIASFSHRDGKLWPE
ncbi:MAG: hypothetical protein ILA03_09970 [Bacteroidaceae bacterium]|nr:hypothetical protein [Bacteroidaceae bacterium]